MYLNKSQFRLLDDLINRNFQQGTLRYEWLRPFQTESTGVTPGWDFTNAERPAIVPFPVAPDKLIYYLISVNGVSLKSGLTEDTKFNDGCENVPIESDAPEFPMTKLVQLDVIETGQAIDRTHNAFYGNNPRSPRAEALADGIRIYRDESFIISDVSFEYIFEPPLIEVEGVPSTEVLPWSVSANQKIIDYTVEYMRLTISDPTYQANVNDFNTRTQNA